MRVCDALAQIPTTKNLAKMLHKWIKRHTNRKCADKQEVCLEQHVDVLRFKGLKCWWWQRRPKTNLRESNQLTLGHKNLKN